jgi:hypothetical protein
MQNCCYLSINILPTMLTHIHPKIPMRSKAATKDFYVRQLQFTDIGMVDYDGYLMLQKDGIEIHFFEYKNLDPATNYGQVYIRTTNIDSLYQWMLDNKIAIHPNDHLQIKPWKQKEFSLLDPDNNLITFGESV